MARTQSRWAAVAVAGVVALGVGLLGMPPLRAAADVDGVSPSAPLPPEEIEVSGTLLVIPGEAEPVTVQAGDAVPEVEPGPPHVSLLTEEQTLVEITGVDADEAASGESFTGTVAVPDEVAEAVQAEVVENGLTLDAVETAELVTEVAAQQEAPLEVVSGDVQPSVAAAVEARQHLVDVIWYGMPGDAIPSPADVNAAIDRLSEFWSTQSNGQVSSVVRALPPIFAPGQDWDVCDEFDGWTRAAAFFGLDPDPTNPAAYYWAGENAHHLVVLVPAERCGGGGLGSLGRGIHTGGLIHAGVSASTPANWDLVLFHEFGHNVSLRHAHSRSCVAPKVDSAYSPFQMQPSDPDCVDTEYDDRYDVMGGGLTFVGNGTATTLRNVPALSVANKVALDALPLGAGLQRVTTLGGETQTVPLAAVTADAGVRGLEVVDPLSGERLYVEYRAGTGRDALSFYAQFATVVGDDQYAPGVRVQRQYREVSASGAVSGYSTVIQRHATHPAYARAQWLGTGDELTSYTGGVTVRVIATTTDAATVEISFSDGLEKFTQVATPAIAGEPVVHWGQTVQVVAAGPAAWAPIPTTVAYQWLRNGEPIPGARATTYEIGGADVGQQLTVRATATREGFTTVERTSTPVTPTGPTTTRLSGATRYDTAVQVSTAAFPGTAPVVYLATGADYADALTAAPAAAREGGPLLLVPSAGAVPSTVLERIAALAPARVVVVGGTGVIPAAIVDQVRAVVPTAVVQRRAGDDRYQTGNALVRAVFDDTAPDEIYIATGRNYPDALSASAVAGGRGVPVILVAGDAPALDAATLDLIDDLGAPRAVIVGGTSVVSAGIEAQLRPEMTVVRLAGADRYETSATINETSFPGPVPQHVWATGIGFPDALTGAVLAAVRDAPLFVVRPSCVPPGAAQQAGVKLTAEVTLVGGEGALAPAVAQLARC